MALWVNERIAGRASLRMAYFTADRAADDRGREHLAVLLHAAITACSNSIIGALGVPSHNWLGDAGHALPA